MCHGLILFPDDNRMDQRVHIGDGYGTQITSVVDIYYAVKTQRNSQTILHHDRGIIGQIIGAYDI